MPPDYQRVLSGVYRPPRESTIYADISVDAAVVEAFMASERAAGRRVTLTAIASLAAGHALRTVPEANVVWRRGRFHRRPDVSTWIYGTSDDGHVTGGLVVHGAGGLPALQARVDSFSRHRDPEAAARSRSAYASLGRGGALRVRALLWAASAWIHGAGGRVPGFRHGESGFGAVAISNVGSLGIPTAPAIPLPPFARHVVLVSMGTVHDHAWVRDGQVVAGRRLPMTAALDHRAFVGLAAGRLMAAFQAPFQDAALLARLARGDTP